MRQAANHVSELKARQAVAPVYTYVLDWELNSVVRASHGSDVPLVFDNVAAAPTFAAAPDSQTLADQMSAAWIAFARTGNPNHDKLPHWPQYDLASRANMVFNTHSHVVKDYGNAAREFWEAL
jgi:para-nitrobenzyl esterase